MLNQIFNPNNGFFRTLSRIFDTVMLGVLWLVCSLPVVTAGAASAALYYAVVKCVRFGEDSPYRNFFSAFRANLRPSLIPTLIFIAAALPLAWGYGVTLALANSEGGTMMALYIAYLLALVVPLGTLCYTFPLLSRFTLRPLELLFFAFRLAIGHLPSTVVLVLIFLQAADLCLRYWYFSFLPLLLCPGVVAVLFSLFLERIFRPLTPAEKPPEEGEEAPWYLR